MGKKNLFSNISSNNNKSEKSKISNISSLKNYPNIETNSFNFIINKSSGNQYNSNNNICINDKLYSTDGQNKFSFITNNSIDINSNNLEIAIKNNFISFNNENATKSDNKIFFEDSANKKKPFLCKICQIYFTRKSHLKKHYFYKHSGYEGTICLYCRKKIKRIKDHIKYCKLKSLRNKIKFGKNKKQITNLFDSPIPKESIKNELNNVNDFASHYNIYLNTKKCKYQNFKNFKVYFNFKIGERGNMTVYYRKDNKINDDLAIKIDTKKKKKSHIDNESIFLSILSGIKGVPTFYYNDYYGGKNIIAESLLGLNLRNIYKFTNFNFDWIFISLLGMNLINLLEKIHLKGIIHNDVKPANICWGKFSNGNLINTDIFYLTDFGYSKIYNPTIIKLKNKDYTKNLVLTDSKKLNDAFEGTAKFMAIDISRGFYPSPKTDLEELMYSLFYLKFRKIPWENAKAKTHKDLCIKMGAIKEKLLESNYFDNIYPEIKYIFKSIRKLEIDETPDYALYIILFESLLRKVNTEFFYSKGEYLQKMVDKVLNIDELNNKDTNVIENIKNILEGYPLVFNFPKK